MVRVKISGIRTLDAALAAVEAGAHALGFVFARPRRVTPQEAERIIRELPPFVSRVGVFVDVPRQEVLEIAGDCRLDVLQFHGGEAPDYCRGWRQQVIKAFRVRDGSVLEQMDRYDVDACLLDAYVPGRAGGTGQCFDWGLARQAVAPAKASADRAGRPSPHPELPPDREEYGAGCPLRARHQAGASFWPGGSPRITWNWPYARPGRLPST